MTETAHTPLPCPNMERADSHHRLIEAMERFIADYDDDDRADAGIHPLMEAHIADFRAALREAGHG